MSFISTNCMIRSVMLQTLSIIKEIHTPILIRSLVIIIIKKKENGVTKSHAKLQKNLIC